MGGGTEFHEAVDVGVVGDFQTCGVFGVIGLTMAFDAVGFVYFQLV